VVEPASVQHCDAFINVKAVDDDVWRSGLWLLGTKASNDRAILVDSGLGPESADHPHSAHVTGNRCIAGNLGFG